MMLREEAEHRSRTAGREKHFLQETWYCGIINQKIEDAAEKGQYEVKVRFSARSYPARHQQRFIELYEAQGYEAFSGRIMFILNPACGISSCDGFRRKSSRPS